MNEHVKVLKGAAARERGIAACYPVGSPMHTDCQRNAEAYEAAIAALGQGEARAWIISDAADRYQLIARAALQEAE